jgi:hypothetical protein
MELFISFTEFFASVELFFTFAFFPLSWSCFSICRVFRFCGAVYQFYRVFCFCGAGSHYLHKRTLFEINCIQHTKFEVVAEVKS